MNLYNFHRNVPTQKNEKEGGLRKPTVVTNDTKNRVENKNHGK